MVNRQPSNSKVSTGFTLVELLVALFVFSLISAFAYRAVNTLVKTGDAIEAEMTALTKVQKAVQIIERDLRQKSVQVVAELDTEQVNAQPDNSELELTVLASSSLSTQALLKHIRYRLQDKVLVREVWKNNKSTADEPDELVELLTDLSKAEFTRLDSVASSTTHAWPAYVQLALEHESLGSIKRSVYLGLKEPDLKFSSLNESGN